MHRFLHVLTRDDLLEPGQGSNRLQASVIYDIIEQLSASYELEYEVSVAIHVVS